MPSPLSLASVLVLGAGELGMSVLEGLCQVKASHSPETTICCLFRDATLSSPTVGQQRALSKCDALGVQPVAGDLASSIDTLASLFAGYDAVISCSGFGGEVGTQVKTARAAIAAGVHRYIPWQFGVDYDAIGSGSAQHLFDEQLEVRTLLKSREASDAGLHWLIVSTGIFTSFVFWEPWGVVQNWRGRSDKPIIVCGLGSWTNRLTVTAVEDIGMITAHALFDKELENTVIYTAGETFEWRILADSIEAVTGRDVERRLLTAKEAQDTLSQNPENVLDMYKAVFTKNVGVAWDMERTYNATKGIATKDVARWLDAQTQGG